MKWVGIVLTVLGALVVVSQIAGAVMRTSVGVEPESAFCGALVIGIVAFAGGLALVRRHR